MTTAQILGYPLLPIAALELFLGFLLLRQNPRNSPVNKATAACAFAAAAWSLSASLMYIRVSLGQDYLLFARFCWVGWFTVPTALQSVMFLNDEKSRPARLLGMVLYPFWTVVLGLCLFTNLVVTDGYVPLPYQNSPGPLEMPLRLFGGLLVFGIFYEILRLRRRAAGYRRSQLNYYLYGTVLFGVGGAVIGGFLQLFTGRGLEPSLSSYFSFPWTVMLFYAITRYRLFDIRLVVSRTLGILFLSFIISALQFMLFKALEPAFGVVATIFISVPLIGALFFITRLNRIVQRWIDDLVLGRRYAYRTMLKQSAEAMISILHRDELLHYIVDSVRDGFEVRNACLYLRDDDDRYVSKQIYGAYRVSSPAALVPRNIIELLRRIRQPIIREEQEIHAGPDDEDIAALMRGQGIEIIVPLFFKGQLLGMLMLGERGSGDPYLQTDIEMLQALAGHAAVAIENARLFEQALRMQSSLRESEGIFHTLADMTAAAIIIHRGDRLLYINAACIRLTGYSADELLGMDFWAIVHPDHRELVRTRGQARLNNPGEAPYYEFKVVTKDGQERWAFMTAGLIEYEGSPAVIATLMDITGIKRSEEERERLFAEKEKILKDLHDGIGGLSTNINLIAELAQKSENIADIRNSLATIADLSRENLLEIRGFIHSLDVRELSWQAVAAELRSLGASIIEPHGIKLSIETSVLEQSTRPGSTVVMNLFRIYKESLSNIVKHAKATSVAVTFKVHDGAVVLDIKDNGVGLGENRGTGRGLLNMQTRADAIGGMLTLNSAGGTRVLLEVPVS